MSLVFFNDISETSDKYKLPWLGGLGFNWVVSSQ